jgi:hypothetical protein
MTIPAKAIKPPAAIRSPVRPGTINPVTITAKTTTTRTTDGQLILPKGVRTKNTLRPHADPDDDGRLLGSNQWNG